MASGLNGDTIARFLATDQIDLTNMGFGHASREEAVGALFSGVPARSGKVRVWAVGVRAPRGSPGPENGRAAFECRVRRDILALNTQTRSANLTRQK